MTPFDNIAQTLEPYLIGAALLGGFALWLLTQIALSLAVLWLAKVPIAMFICAGAHTPTEQAMRWILWPLKPRAAVS
jgi:hypothetical protein